jgi:hypothetical protein
MDKVLALKVGNLGSIPSWSYEDFLLICLLLLERFEDFKISLFYFSSRIL